jgi:hypothetical protein
VELSDGIDFLEWNATVRSLSSAVERLHQSARLLAEPPWMPALIRELEELNLHFRRFEENQMWLPRSSESAESEPVIHPSRVIDSALECPAPVTGEPLDPTADDLTEGTGGAARLLPEKPRHQQSDHVSPSIRFGDPDDIARYSRRRRR